MKPINGDTIKYFYLYRFIHAAGIYWVTAVLAKGCKGNGRSGPCRSGVYYLIRNIRHIHMKQLENNPQVLYKQEDGEGWGHCFVCFLRGKTLYMYACLVRSRRGNSRLIKQECLCVSLLCKTVQGPQCHLAEALPFINVTLGVFLTSVKAIKPVSRFVAWFK